MLREELKSKDFFIKDLLQTIKEIKTKSVSVQSITSCMSTSEANLVTANNSVAIEDVCNNNDEIVDTNDEILIPDKKDINHNILKKSMQNQLEEVIKEKKENSTNSKTLTTKILSQQPQTTVEKLKGNIQAAQQSFYGTPF